MIGPLLAAMQLFLISFLLPKKGLPQVTHFWTGCNNKFMPKPSNTISFVTTFKILQNMKCLQNISIHGTQNSWFDYSWYNQSDNQNFEFSRSFGALFWSRVDLIWSRVVHNIQLLHYLQESGKFEILIVTWLCNQCFIHWFLSMGW